MLREHVKRHHHTMPLWNMYRTSVRVEKKDDLCVGLVKNALVRSVESFRFDDYVPKQQTTTSHERSVIDVCSMRVGAAIRPLHDPTSSRWVQRLLQRIESPEEKEEVCKKARLELEELLCPSSWWKLKPAILELEYNALRNIVNVLFLSGMSPGNGDLRKDAFDVATDQIPNHVALPIPKQSSIQSTNSHVLPKDNTDGEISFDEDNHVRNTTMTTANEVSLKQDHCEIVNERVATAQVRNTTMTTGNEVSLKQDHCEIVNERVATTTTTTEHPQAISDDNEDDNDSQRGDSASCYADDEVATTTTTTEHPQAISDDSEDDTDNQSEDSVSCYATESDAESEALILQDEEFEEDLSKSSCPGEIIYKIIEFKNDFTIHHRFVDAYGDMAWSSITDIFCCLMKRHDFTELSGFVDVGSGTGHVNLFLSVTHKIALNMGVEINQKRYQQSMKNRDMCIEYMGGHRTSIGSVQFVPGDIGEIELPRGVTHLFCNDMAFPESELAKVWDVYAKSSIPFLICFKNDRHVGGDALVKKKLYGDVLGYLTSHETCNGGDTWQLVVYSSSNPYKRLNDSKTNKLKKKYND